MWPKAGALNRGSEGPGGATKYLRAQSLRMEEQRLPPLWSGRNREDRPVPSGSRVRHKVWGEGEILRVEGDALALLFDSVGCKTFALGAVVENKLLEEAG